MTYTVNVLGPIFMLIAAAVYLGAFGGTAFEQGVAGLLVLLTAEAIEFTIEGENGALKQFVLVAAPLAVLLYFIGLVLTLAGLS